MTGGKALGVYRLPRSARVGVYALVDPQLADLLQVKINGVEASVGTGALVTAAADLLALTSHSRTVEGVQRFFGSVAEAVLSKAGCPLLLHRVGAPAGSATQ